MIKGQNVPHFGFTSIPVSQISVRFCRGFCFTSTTFGVIGHFETCAPNYPQNGIKPYMINNSRFMFSVARQSVTFQSGLLYGQPFSNKLPF